MPWNLLILPLLAGFIFIHECHFFSFRSHRLESERLLLRSAVAGVVFAILGRVSVLIALQTPLGVWLRSLLHESAPFPYLGTALASLLIGYGSAHFINGIARLLGGRAWFRLYLAAQTDNGLLKLLHQCMNDESQIFVSLVNRKVYVGWVADAPRTPHDSYFMLALTLSGHRDERTLEFRETENYTKRMPAAPTGKDAFLMLIDLRHVATAYPFDRDRYEREFALKTKATSIYVP